jgi:hypothetical protein
MLAKLSLVLREQHERCRIVPMISVGLLIRSSYERKRVVDTNVVRIDDNLVESDTAATIGTVCTAVRERTASKYVGKGKVAEEVFVRYFDVIECGLRGKFTGSYDHDGSDGSLYEELKKLMPNLTKDEYAKQHRNRLEYLLKLVEKEARKRLKNGMVE